MRYKECIFWGFGILMAVGCLTCKYLRYLLVIELFWLAFTGYLEFPEFIAGTEAVCDYDFRRMGRAERQILKKEGIFLEEDKLIDQYFLAFAHTIANAGEKTAENVLNVIHGKGRRDSKEYINSKIERTEKPYKEICVIISQ